MHFVFAITILFGNLGGAAFERCHSCGRRRGGHADAEMAAEAGAWCEPARTAARRGRGADAPWVCSQVEAIMASIVSNVD